MDKCFLQNCKSLLSMKINVFLGNIPENSSGGSYTDCELLLIPLFCGNGIHKWRNQLRGKGHPTLASLLLQPLKKSYRLSSERVNYNCWFRLDFIRFHIIKNKYKLNFSIPNATQREIQTYWQVYFFIYFKGSVSGVPQCPP